jgi:hypothetical protein
MKRISLIYLFCLLAIAGWGQNLKSEILVKKVWLIHSEKMSGVGVHNSLPPDTELQFSADGTWKSSQPFRDALNGTWQLENNDRTLVIMANNEKTKYAILQLIDNELNLRLKKNAATFNYYWLSRK